MKKFFLLFACVITCIGNIILTSGSHNKPNFLKAVKLVIDHNLNEQSVNPYISKIQLSLKKRCDEQPPDVILLQTNEEKEPSSKEDVNYIPFLLQYLNSIDYQITVNEHRLIDSSPSCIIVVKINKNQTCINDLEEEDLLALQHVSSSVIVLVGESATIAGGAIIGLPLAPIII